MRKLVVLTALALGTTAAQAADDRFYLGAGVTEGTLTASNNEVNVTCVKNALYDLHPDPKCGSDGNLPLSGILSSTGVLTLGNPSGFNGVGQ
jgi:hypothetical protein